MPNLVVVGVKEIGGTGLLPLKGTDQEAEVMPPNGL